jgi:hypothetical protein
MILMLFTNTAIALMMGTHCTHAEVSRAKSYKRGWRPFPKNSTRPQIFLKDSIQADKVEQSQSSCKEIDGRIRGEASDANLNE